MNHPVDRDPVCGFSGIIKGKRCPACGRTEDEVPFERLRRITGYLVGTLDRWNDGKKAEEHDRVKHSVGSSSWGDDMDESEEEFAAKHKGNGKKVKVADKNGVYSKQEKAARERLKAKQKTLKGKK